MQILGEVFKSDSCSRGLLCRITHPLRSKRRNQDPAFPRKLMIGENMCKRTTARSQVSRLLSWQCKKYLHKHKPPSLALRTSSHQNPRQPSTVLILQWGLKAWHRSPELVREISGHQQTIIAGPAGTEHLWKARPVAAPSRPQSSAQELL